MKLSFVTYDVFTDGRFGRYPLSVVEAPDVLSHAQIQTLCRD